MEKVKRKINISAVRQELYTLNKKRTGYIFRLLHGKPMVHGLAHEVFRRCGKSNCRCAGGELHGPYPALSVNKDGRQRTVMIKKIDVRVVLEQAGRYRKYQETLASIRKINRRINELLEDVKSTTTRSYP